MGTAFQPVGGWQSLTRLAFIHPPPPASVSWSKYFSNFFELLKGQKRSKKCQKVRKVQKFKSQVSKMKSIVLKKVKSRQKVRKVPKVMASTRKVGEKSGKVTPLFELFHTFHHFSSLFHATCQLVNFFPFEQQKRPQKAKRKMPSC
jgi:hypothetical protein